MSTLRIHYGYFAALSLLTIAVPRLATASPPIPDDAAWETVDCSAFNLPPLMAALSDCGYVTVPEFHAQPSAETIQIAVVRTRSIGENPASDPLFLGQGGPGDSAIYTFAERAIPGGSQLLELLKERDIVSIAQRGTEFSRPHLACPEETAHNIAVEKGELPSDDAGWMVACRDRFLAEGVNFSAFNSVENAADFYAVAELLGYDQFNYYGGSYGTLLGQYMLAQADYHAAELRSVILDSVATANVDFNVAIGYAFSGSLRQLFADCQADEECNQRYPNLESVFLETVDRLNQAPVPVTLTVPETEEAIDTVLDADDFLVALFSTSYSVGALPSRPQRIYQVANGDYAWLTEMVMGNLAPLGPGAEAAGMHNAILCTRQPSIQAGPETLLPAPYPELAYLGPDASSNVARFCDVLQVETEPPFELQPTQIPTLIFNGEDDPVTPAAYGEAVAQALGTSYVYTLPGVGHINLIHRPDISNADDCAGAIAREFLANPHQTPDSRCITDLAPQFDLAD